MTMKVGQEEVTFHWRNYFKPTPSNLELLSSMIRDIILGVSAITIVNDYKWFSFGLAVSGIVFNQVVKFFSNVADRENGTKIDPV